MIALFSAATHCCQVSTHCDTTALLRSFRLAHLEFARTFNIDSIQSRCSVMGFNRIQSRYVQFIEAKHENKCNCRMKSLKSVFFVCFPQIRSQSRSYLVATTFWYFPRLARIKTNQDCEMGRFGVLSQDRETAKAIKSPLFPLLIL